ncbi:hypothetical protein B0T09DRAFT_381371 [Sordaria sp. MPI-SDFR-AT-0083]|nr:hypothetical protein B0T09DRAFT_381371 [Sordaria sp. MPI-SDFR-AT-0083]
MITHGTQFDAHGWTHDPTLVDEPPRYFLATSDADAHLSMRLSVQDLPPQYPWPAAAADDDDEDFECPTAGGSQQVMILAYDVTCRQIFEDLKDQYDEIMGRVSRARRDTFKDVEDIEGEESEIMLHVVIAGFVKLKYGEEKEEGWEPRREVGREEVVAFAREKGGGGKEEVEDETDTDTDIKKDNKNNKNMASENKPAQNPPSTPPTLLLPTSITTTEVIVTNRASVDTFFADLIIKEIYATWKETAAKRKAKYWERERIEKEQRIKEGRSLEGRIESFKEGKGFFGRRYSFTVGKDRMEWVKKKKMRARGDWHSLILFNFMGLIFHLKFSAFFR